MYLAPFTFLFLDLLGLRIVAPFGAILNWVTKIISI
jgi:hypothetical protein